MDYGISDKISPDNIRVEILKVDCEYPTLIDGIISQTFDANGALVFQIDPEILSKNDKVFNSDGYPDKATMQFCLRYMLWTGSETDDNAIEVNYKETILTIDFNMKKGFEMDGASAVPSEIYGDKNNIADREGYGVEGYLCDINTLEKIPTPDGYSQGDSISICSKIGASAAEDGIFLKGVDYFYWKREFKLGGIPTTTIQYAMKDGVIANMLTQYSCTADALFCSFSTMLLADFFTAKGIVSGQGQVSMQFGTSQDRRSRRFAAEKTNLRSLQQQQQDTDVAADYASSGFSISIPVMKMDDRPGFLPTAGGASYGTTSLARVIGSFVTAVLLFGE